MRIATCTETRLVIEHRPRSLMLLLAALAGVALVLATDLAIGGSGWAVVFFAAGLALAVLVHEDFRAHTTVTLDRETGEASILWLDSAGVTHRTLPLSQVTKAGVQTIRSHDGPPIRRTVLTTPERSYPLTRDFLSTPAPERVARRINDWLSGKTA